MKKFRLISVLVVLVILVGACKKQGCTDPSALNYDSKAKKDDGSCTYDDQALYTVPDSYNFTNSSGNSTVNFSGQTDRLNQLKEMLAYMKTGIDNPLNATQLKDMFSNVNDNGNGAFSFTSTKQLKDKCFDLDRELFESWMDSIALASVYFNSSAANGMAGVLISDTNRYLVSHNGIEYIQLLEKGLMGAIFMYQALNTYFSDSEMNVDNTTAVDPANGLYYTAMEHHWDEAFGYFGVPNDFPATIPSQFWGKYCDQQDSKIGSNATMMNHFLKGRAAISNKILEDRDASIHEIKVMWEKIAASQALDYLQEATSNYADPAKRLHALSEAYGFILCLRYTPIDTRKMSNAEVTAMLAKFGQNFWDLTSFDIQEIKTDLEAKY